MTVRWRRALRDARVRRAQRVTLRKTHDASIASLIVLVVPGADPGTGVERLWGGVLAILSICEEMKRASPVHGADVVLCTFPGETPLLRHTLFPSDTDVFELERALEYFASLQSLTLHVPEYAAPRLPSLLGARHLRRLAEIEFVHVNVLNQNIDLLPSPDELKGLRALSTRMTMTTAHRQYCTRELSRRYSMPIHHLSVPVDIDGYRHPSFEDKEDLVLFSPDDPTRNREVAQILSRAHPELVFVEIRGLPYWDYRRLLERARWMFTFGEGLDYYLLESVLSGGVAFTIFNDRFFTPEFAELDTVYTSFEQLHSQLDADFSRLTDSAAHESYRRVQVELVARGYGLRQFRDNLERFLGSDYTVPLDEALARPD